MLIARSIIHQRLCQSRLDTLLRRVDKFIANSSKFNAVRASPSANAARYLTNSSSTKDAR